MRRIASIWRYRGRSSSTVVCMTVASSGSTRVVSGVLIGAVTTRRRYPGLPGRQILRGEIDRDRIRRIDGSNAQQGLRRVIEQLDLGVQVGQLELGEHALGTRHGGVAERLRGIAVGRDEIEVEVGDRAARRVARGLAAHGP